MSEFRFLLICSLLMTCGWSEAQQTNENNRNGNIRIFPQISPNPPDDDTNNHYISYRHNSYTPLKYSYANGLQQTASPRQPSSSEGYENANQLYFTSPSQTPTQFWTGPPIIVGDDYFYNNHNVQQHQSNNPTHMQRNPKNLTPVPYNHRQVQKPSDYHYDNQAVIYHSDVRRHEILTSPPQDDLSNQQDFISLQHPEASELQQLPHFFHLNNRGPSPVEKPVHASNTDLNYLRAVASSLYSEEQITGQASKADYNKYFEEYIKKYPRRIRPVF
ncbi:uncharacterized protein LOC142232672 isoform X2 [Haematobia irritans]|uniref:uncharacterized protein LOC142232672 isoform X2 n=1 Tax=Haematobia irritans TaxID=7368 RepID=UPI003F502146